MAKPIVPINSALIQDEVLGELALVLNGTKPAGPNFLNCVGSVVEACVLHESVFVLPAREFEDVGANPGLTTLIDESEFTASLLREGVFKPFPPRVELDDYLAGVGGEYNTFEFIKDLRWTAVSMLPSNSDQEEALWWFEDFILKQAPELFEDEFCTDQNNELDVPNSAIGHKLVDQGFPVAQLITLEGWNRQVRALQKIAQLTGLNLYVVPSATMHQLGSLSAVNLKARAAYERIQSEKEPC